MANPQLSLAISLLDVYVLKGISNCFCLVDLRHILGNTNKEELTMSKHHGKNILVFIGRWLKTIKLYFLLDLEFRNLKSRNQQGHALS